MVTYSMVGVGLTLAYALMRGLTWQGSAHLHTVMETIATFLALMVGIIALVRFYSKKNNTILFIGAGFLGTAFLDGYHAVVTSEFFAPYLPSDLPSLIPWSWIASRLFLSVLLCLSWLAWTREQQLGKSGRIKERSVYLFTGILTLASFLFFAFLPLPPAYYPEIVFHRPEEFLPALFFLIALIGYLRKGDWRGNAFEHWLVLSLIVGLVGQAVFMSYSGRLFDLEFDAAHLLKKVSYVCVLTGLLVSMHSIFWQAEKSTRTLAEANARLRSEVNERERAELALRESEETLRAIVDNSPTKIHIKDLEGRYVLINRQSEMLFGVPREEAIGKTSREIFPKEVADSFLGHDQSVRDTGETVEAEEEWLHEDGVHTYLTVKFPIRGADGNITAVGAIGTDITERKRSQTQIEQIALYDSLTGLPNRFLFHNRLRKALAQSKRANDKLALMFLDLDDFKDVNDSLGHDAGDELLKAVAKRLKAELRDTDTVGLRENTLARLGGDEFTIILTNLADPMDAATVAERIIANMESQFTVGENKISSGISIGIAVYPTHGTEPEELLKTADLALYRAKAKGRNTYHFYTEDLENDVLVRKALQEDLRKAMDEGQLSLVYQPQIDVMSGHPVGLEALLRWNHPQRGLVARETFVPIAEATGLILPIGEWVLHQACAQNKAWQEAGLPAIPVAVNISPVQFRHENLLPTVEGALCDTGLDPAYLCVEITESVVMQNDFVESGTLHGLRRLGIKIALDDFGTGYSSLSYLTRIPVDKIKLDRGFLHDIEYDAGGAAIVKAMVSLGHNLQMRINVEGVETLDQLAVLSSSGVDEIQGHYFSEPLAPEAVAEFLSETTVSFDKRMAGA